MKRLLTTLLILFFAQSLSAAELSQTAIAGDWIFSHMFLDGSPEKRSVNRKMTVKPNGSVINSPDIPAKRSEARLDVESASTLVYTDKRGKQIWKVEKYTGDELQVNHKGAVMVLMKQ